MQGNGIIWKSIHLWGLVASRRPNTLSTFAITNLHARYSYSLLLLFSTSANLSWDDRPFGGDVTYYAQVFWAVGGWDGERVTSSVEAYFSAGKPCEGDSAHEWAGLRVARRGAAVAVGLGRSAVFAVGGCDGSRSLSCPPILVSSGLTCGTALCAGQLGTSRNHSVGGGKGLLVEVHSLCFYPYQIL